jgi:hypothetical protein
VHAGLNLADVRLVDACEPDGREVAISSAVPRHVPAVDAKAGSTVFDDCRISARTSVPGGCAFSTATLADTCDSMSAN